MRPRVTRAAAAAGSCRVVTFAATLRWKNLDMNDARGTAENVEVVERFLAAFDRRWPAEDELAELVAPDVRFVERPNLINPAGSERDATAMRAAPSSSTTQPLGISATRWPARCETHRSSLRIGLASTTPSSIWTGGAWSWSRAARER